VRALLATAGLLVLAGTAAAGPSTVHTLRKSSGGPIEAIAQDGNLVAWFSSSSRACDAIHVLAPGKPDRSFPQPSSGSMTCHWDLSDGHPQLALAARTAAAIWTLHESGPAPFDYVVTAPIGGPERKVDRLAHASDGTGDWLGGVTGSDRTLAYSWVDVEYVDKIGCLSGKSCAQKIAGGGIKLVSATASTTLPGSDPALSLATAGGLLAYIPATAVGKGGQPAASPGTAIQVVDADSGNEVSHVTPRGTPLAIALSPNVLAVLAQLGDHDRISWYDPIVGTKIGSVAVSPQTSAQIAADDDLIVFRVGRLLNGIDTGTGKIRTIVKVAQNALGPSLERGELVWAENTDQLGRLRAVPVG
jgi:hypothetical protein